MSDLPIDHHSTDLDNQPSMSVPGQHKDLALAQAILGGSEPAWQRFVLQYTALVLSVARRYLSDEDDARALHADVLVRLKNGKLGAYRGVSALSTWLVVVTRALCLDQLRRRDGRHVVPRSVERLGPQDRRVFDLFFIQGCRLREVRDRLREESGPETTTDTVLDAIARIRSEVDDHVFRKYEFRLHPESRTLAATQLRMFMDTVDERRRQDERQQSPELILMLQEAQEHAEKVLANVQRLGEADQKLLELRFSQGLTAKQLAQEMGLKDQRAAYRRLDRILAQLKTWAGGSRE